MYEILNDVDSHSFVYFSKYSESDIRNYSSSLIQSESKLSEFIRKFIISVYSNIVSNTFHVTNEIYLLLFLLWLLGPFSLSLVSLRIAGQSFLSCA
jgi:hypothetical protein